MPQCPVCTHTEFPYHFDDDQGITWGTFTDRWDSLVGDMLIYYNTLDTTDYIDCFCSRWDVDNYEFIIETWLKKDDLDTLLTYITPGATGELYQILGSPKYYDKTWTGGNTLLFYPLQHNEYNSLTDTFRGNNPSKLQSMRQERIGYVKNVTTSHIEGTTGWMWVKLNCYTSGNVL